MIYSIPKGHSGCLSYRDYLFAAVKELTLQNIISCLDSISRSWQLWVYHQPPRAASRLLIQLASWWICLTTYIWLSNFDCYWSAGRCTNDIPSEEAMTTMASTTSTGLQFEACFDGKCCTKRVCIRTWSRPNIVSGN